LRYRIVNVYPDGSVRVRYKTPEIIEPKHLKFKNTEVVGVLTGERFTVGENYEFPGATTISEVRHSQSSSEDMTELVAVSIKKHRQNENGSLEIWTW